MAVPCVSVVMPCYNHERFVEAAIASVLAQSLGELELIVIDDASSDGSWQVIAGHDDPRLRALRHDTNRGAHTTLNEALALARGEYLAILNSDDVYATDRLERLVAVLAGGDARLAFSDVEFIGAEGKPDAGHSRAVEYRALRDWCARQPAFAWFLAGNTAVSTSNFVFHRSLAEAVGDFAALRYTHDWAWALAAAAHAPLAWVREPLLGYRVHATNTLAEDEHWRHVHENAWVLSAALARLPRILAAQRAAPGEAGQAVRALLRNDSLPPLPLLAFLAERLCGTPEAELLARAAGRPEWWMAELAAADGLPEAIFAALAALREMPAALAAQTRLIEERWQTIGQMSATVAERDEAIAAQKQLIDERWRTIESMSAEIARRDQAIAAQAALLDERYAAMQQMGDRIHQLDCQLAAERQTGEEREAALGSELGALRSELAALRAEHQRLLAHPLVRGGRALKRLLGGRR